MENLGSKKNSWSPEFILIPGLVLVALSCSILANKLVWVSLFTIAAKATALVWICCFLLDLVRLRFRRAMSIIAGFSFMALVAYSSLNALIEHRIAGFDQIIEAQRASRNSTGSATSVVTGGDGLTPIRMIVSFEGTQPSYLGRASFDYIVFDETDQIELDPSALLEFSPYPGSAIAAIDEYSPKSIVKIRGHYYKISESQ